MAFDKGLCLVTVIRKQPLSRTDQSRLDDALAALLANTRRGKRKLTLVEFVEKLHVAIDFLGSLRAVAETISLSEEMVRQFTRVEKLSPAVKKLAASGKLNSVDLVDRLSRLPAEDQLPVARSVLSGDLNSVDVKTVLAFRKTSPATPIKKVIDRIKRSRNIREYVAEFVVPQPPPGQTLLMKRLSKALGRQNIRAVEVGERTGRVVLDTRGKVALEQGAKEANLTKGKFIEQVVSGKAG